MLMNELSMILLMKLHVGIGVRIKETIFKASISLKLV